MNTLEFLRTILPEEGVYYAAIFKPGLNAPTHKPFHSLETMADALVEMDAYNWTVYHACASYKKDFVEVNAVKTGEASNDVRVVQSSRTGKRLNF